jgi:hypothetical protein
MLFFRRQTSWCTVLTTLTETFWPIHVNLFAHVSVEESTVDIGMFAVKAELSHKREADPKSGELHGMSKGLIEVQAMDM